MFKTNFILLLVLCGSFQARAFIEPPPKFLDSNFNVRAPREPRFSLSLIQSGQFENVKRAEWEACRRHRIDFRPFAAAHDRLEFFIENPISLDTLEKMEAKSLKASSLTENPWSGDYWAYANGLLGVRFMDPKFSDHSDWLSRYQYVQQNPAPLLIEQKGQDAINELSPSEKYDVLTGNAQGSFTESQWEQGKEYYNESGEVEGWMGICHGWAPAAIMEPRPAKSVDTKSFDGKWNLHFNPSEIKGLVSYSWATNFFPVVSLGQRCNQKNPKHDSNGRLTQPECFDLNPATWHMAVVHRIGLEKSSFVMDANFDYEVWNQPVVGYSYSYFNPETKKPALTLQEAQVAKEQYSKDPFVKYRSAETRTLVGIEMKVGYVVESGASEEDTDSPANDLIRWVNYSYDLELDSNGKIIGGEWYQDSHPDFIWTPKKGVKPLSAMDRGLSDQKWNDGEPIPGIWADAAKTGAPQGSILNAIAEGILHKSASP